MKTCFNFQSPTESSQCGSKPFVGEQFKQKRPISFISPKDWQKYLQFTKGGRNNDKKHMGIIRRRKNSRVIRLLHSFHKLYEEYSKTCIRYSSSLKCSGDTTRISLLCDNIHSKQYLPNGCKGEDNAEVLDLSDELLIDVEVQTFLTSEDVEKDHWYLCKSFDAMSSEVVNKSVVSPWGIQALFNPIKRLSRYFRQVTSSTLKIRDIKSFDKIIKTENDIHMEVMEEVNHQLVVFHKLSMDSIDNHFFKLKKQKLVQIPLAIELLSPRIQRMIEDILNDCPFLCDPLEVAAELRQFGYDQSACTEFFRMTKCLRYVIEEMMPNNPFNNNEVKLPSMTSSVLSMNDDPPIYNPLNDAIKTTNDSVKPTLNLEHVHSSVTDCGGVPEKCSPNRIHYAESQQLPSTTESVTQTSKVHFFMDDKNMELFFYEIKHYIFNMRQLHSETREEIKYLQKQLSSVFASLKGHFGLLINQSSEQLIFDEQKNKMLNAFVVIAARFIFLSNCDLQATMVS